MHLSFQKPVYWNLFYGPISYQVFLIGHLTTSINLFYTMLQIKVYQPQRTFHKAFGQPAICHNALINTVCTLSNLMFLWSSTHSYDTLAIKTLFCFVCDAMDSWLCAWVLHAYFHKLFTSYILRFPISKTS